jgi:uncharacterized protein
MSEEAQTISSAKDYNPERIELLDAIRGFALLGILLMNLEAFNGPITGALTGIDSNLKGLNWWADVFIYIFVQGKFWTLFSLLFGIGFAVMFERAKQSGGNFAAIYRRRLFALLAIGLIHLLLIWEGDILFSYALAGFVLLWMLKSGKTYGLPGLLVIYCAPLVLLAFYGLSAGSMDNPQELIEILREESEILGASSYSEVLMWRIKGFSQDLFSSLFLLPMTIALFALGVRFYRSGYAKPSVHPEKHSLWMAVTFWFSGLSLMLLSIWIAPEINPLQANWLFAKVNILNMLAGPLMCVGYFFGLRYFWSFTWARNKLQFFTPLGKMALTNYLSQSIVCTLIFYGYGLGCFQQLPRAWHIPFALAFIALQVIFSSWWLKRYNLGPVEYIWRWLTYGKRPKFVS